MIYHFSFCFFFFCARYSNYFGDFWCFLVFFFLIKKKKFFFFQVDYAFCWIWYDAAIVAYQIIRLKMYTVLCLFEPV